MELNFEQIKEILPHRSPFLLIDRVTDLVPGESAEAVKCVSGNEPFFQGHFPEKAVIFSCFLNNVKGLALSGIPSANVHRRLNRSLRPLQSELSATRRPHHSFYM